MNVVTWATESLGAAGTGTLNDFVSPLGLLTAALAYWIGLNDQWPTKQLASSTLPRFLANSAAITAPPWGNRTVADTSPWDFPDTGVTRQYDFTVRRGIVAPDGVNKCVLLVNDQYPGPMIEANWGDWVEVTVHNQIESPPEGTTLHWHGVPQNGTPWSDGTASVSQCPITPGSRFLYRFQASLYGTSWWHSHLSAQYSDGLYGPLVVYGPSQVDYDYDLGPIMIHDYYHSSYTTVLKAVLGNNPLISLLAAADNTLIQSPTNSICSLTASNSSPCHAVNGPAKFNFTSSKKHRIRLINPSSIGSPMLFSIDNHTMTVIANDFVPVQPYNTTVVSIAAGQRTDIVVDATGQPGSSFWMRARQPDLCNNVIQPFALAAIYYEGANINTIPWSLSQPDFLTPLLEQCNNDPLALTEPVYSIPAYDEPDAMVVINMSTVYDVQNQTKFAMNGTAFHGNYSAPILSAAAADNGSFEKDWNVIDLSSKQKIRMVLLNSQPFAHPMHLHGQQFRVLDIGLGPSWNGSITRPSNPQRRDTQLVPANGYMAVDLFGDNPGVWPFHCHKAWHLAPGQMVNLVLAQNDLTHMHAPAQVSSGCSNWARYAAQNDIPELGSGQRR